MKNVIYCLTAIYVLLLLTSCDKNSDLHGNAISDEINPLINIMSPYANDSLNSDTLKLKAQINENDQLHHYGFWVRNVNTGEQYAYFMLHDHAKQINLDTTLVLNDTLRGKTLAVQVFAQDHNSNDTEKTIEFTLK